VHLKIYRPTVFISLYLLLLLSLGYYSPTLFLNLVDPLNTSLSVLPSFADVSLRLEQCLLGGPSLYLSLANSLA
jgi:hypothetical protein